MKQGFESVNLEKIAFQMTAGLDLQEILTTIVQGLVDEFDAFFARIWLLGSGDRCKECYKADVCRNHEKCLHLMASAGKYTNLNGEYRRVPLNESKLGRIATNGESIFTSDLLNDERFPDKKWISENGFRSYGGYPLSLQEKLLGTIAMFSRHQITKPEFNHLSGLPSQASIAIKCAQLFAEVEKLKNHLQAENIYLREEIKLEHNFDEIIGQSADLKYVLFKVEQIAVTDTTVLILGETGTGKELIARAIHSRSARQDRPLVKVSCASLPANLIESELFGHEKGAFTSAQTRQIGRFELADGATIFLDEIGELPLALQSRLLRVLQDGEFERLGNSHTIKADARIISATNRDLEEEVHRGNFRKDLYYRLDIFPITLPPLRERIDDIPLLVDFMSKKFARKLGKQIQAIPTNVMKTLQTYSWPGNVRELENVIERAVINTRGSTLQLAEKLVTIHVEELAKNHWVNCLAYIDLNPLRAGIVSRPEDYRWNSLGYHVQTNNRDNFLSTDFGLKEFNVKSEKERIRRYRRYVYEAGAVNRPEKGKTPEKYAPLSQVNSTGQAKVIGDKILEKERKREFELSRNDRFRYRTRYFTDSGVIGSKEFVSKTYMRFKHHFISKNEKKPKPIKGLSGVYSLKRLSEVI